ncbi:hypothetical protein [Demequina iriomotensis]|uniref:hypothetical protein n=1 Tax=Demequina iriomotensis TaxID=1536641 RepID=UPI0007850EE0|nr:hypothetical protein [Demequina iriomotensis]
MSDERAPTSRAAGKGFGGLVGPRGSAFSAGEWASRVSYALDHVKLCAQQREVLRGLLAEVAFAWNSETSSGGFEHGGRDERLAASMQSQAVVILDEDPHPLLGAFADRDTPANPLLGILPGAPADPRFCVVGGEHSSWGEWSMCQGCAPDYPLAGGVASGRPIGTIDVEEEGHLLSESDVAPAAIAWLAVESGPEWRAELLAHPACTEEVRELFTAHSDAEVVGRYTVTIARSVGQKEYVASVAEFPSVSYLAGSTNAALYGIARVLASIVTDAPDPAGPVRGLVDVGERDRRDVSDAPEPRRSLRRQFQDLPDVSDIAVDDSIDAAPGTAGGDDAGTVESHLPQPPTIDLAQASKSQAPRSPRRGLSVGQLRQALEHLADSTPVTVVYLDSDVEYAPLEIASLRTTAGREGTVRQELLLFRRMDGHESSEAARSEAPQEGSHDVAVRQPDGDLDSSADSDA